MSAAASRSPEQTRAARLRGDEDALFRHHHQKLLRAVRRVVNAPAALIEDACSIAWVQLVRCQPERGPQLFSWLRTVAVHEAYRLSHEQRRDLGLEQFAGGRDDDPGPEGGWEAFLAAPDQLDTHLEAKRALEVLAGLPERQRRYLALLVAGYRYEEITSLTSATYTNVNKHLTRARESVRQAKRAY